MYMKVTFCQKLPPYEYECQPFSNGISFLTNQRSHGPYLDDCWNANSNNVGLSCALA